MKKLRSGLMDIFSSKLASELREPALKLSGILSHIFGIELAKDDDCKFFLLWLHLVVVVGSVLYLKKGV